MQFQIHSLIIWPKNAEKSPRVLNFAPGRVNVISGKSNTGKSALIKIVDYVLASRDCRIPTIGPIRSYSSWFGLLVITDEGRILLARREAGAAKSTDDYMVMESVPADLSLVSLVPAKNTNRQYVKKLLQRLARLPNLDQDFFETGSGYKGQPSFGDLKAFLFQPQSIVASDTTLFYKTDEESHEGKLKEIFPFALGAITGEILVLRHRYLDAQKRAAILLRKIHALEEHLREAISDVRPKYLLGVQLGLLPVLTWESALPHDDQLQAMQSRLVDLAEVSPATFVEKSDPAAAVKAISELQSHERRLQNLLIETRGRLQQIQELRRGYANLRTDKVEQLNRLRVVEILEGAISVGSTCPVCSSETDEPSRQWSQLKHSLGSLKAEIPEVARALPQLQKEEVLLTRRVNQIEEQIRRTNSELRAMSAAPSFRADDLERARFIGQIQQWSASADDSGTLAELREQYDLLNRDIERLRSDLDEWDVETRMNAVLTRWSILAMRYVEIMRLEEQGKLLQLDTKNLTIRIVLDDGRPSAQRGRWRAQLARLSYCHTVSSA